MSGRRHRMSRRAAAHQVRQHHHLISTATNLINSNGPESIRSGRNGLTDELLDQERKLSAYGLKVDQKVSSILLWSPLVSSESIVLDRRSGEGMAGKAARR